MSKLFIEESSLTAIGDAIRNKTGGSELLSPAAMVTAIESIEGGGGGLIAPNPLVISGQAMNMFSGNTWNWVIEQWGHNMETQGLTQTQNMFSSNTTLTEIPFDINVANNNTYFASMFNSCNSLTSVPRIYGDLKAPTGDYSGVLDLSYLFQNCYKLREIPYDYFTSFGGDAFWEASRNFKGNRQLMFTYCYSLRELPDLSMLKTKSTSSYDVLYGNMCQNCYTLNKVVDLPVLNTCTLTSNTFGYTFSNCYMLKSFTFEINEDGSPIVASGWKSQTIDLSTYVGYLPTASSYKTRITGYNSGVTTDTQVTDDATYQALKDNPDWWTMKVEYSKYNHDSAIETINSLPDVSGSGNSNVIKFKGTAGSLTDGGAINTLTEEEIAIATARGWSVVLI